MAADRKEWKSTKTFWAEPHHSNKGIKVRIYVWGNKNEAFRMISELF